MGTKDWISNARPPTVEVKLEDLRVEDQIKVLEPENAYLRLKLEQQAEVLKQHQEALKECARALLVVTEALKPTNEWPQPHLSSLGEPIVGGDIYRAVGEAVKAITSLK